jgi:hypothetical protein
MAVAVDETTVEVGLLDRLQPVLVRIDDHDVVPALENGTRRLDRSGAGPRVGPAPLACSGVDRETSAPPRTRRRRESARAVKSISDETCRVGG